MEIKETKAVSIDDVISILEDGEGSAELTYEQQLALQHAKKNSVPKAKSEKIKKTLEEMKILNERSIIKILEVMPKNQMTLKQILAPEKRTFSDEELVKVLALTKDKG